jgi:hypothetical protein
MYDQGAVNRYGARIAGFVSDMILHRGLNVIRWSSATGISSVTFKYRGAYA